MQQSGYANKCYEQACSGELCCILLLYTVFKLSMMTIVGINGLADANCSDSGADFDCETLGSSIRMMIQLVLREWANLPSIKSSLVIKENSLVWN